MEPTHKNNDCYFFYYSTCTKGDSCAFRHEPSALGCEVMCSYWQQGNCLNEHCNFRHMELKKNRKSIPCFWESQRGGCKKPHCPFMHLGGRPATGPDAANPIKTTEVTSKPVTQEWSNRPDDGKYDGSGTESDQGRGSSEAGSFIGSPAVDPLIVNFDEESDSESAPSPVKPHTARVPYCKTYEEIRLEEIQAESAAYYSYEPDDYLGSIGGGKEKRITSVRAARRMITLYPRERPSSTGKSTIITVAAATTTATATTTTATTTTTTTTTATTTTGAVPDETTTATDFTILTLEEIRRRKSAQIAQSNEMIIPSCDNSQIRKIPHRRKESFTRREDTSSGKESADFLKDAIKTLAELKASAASLTKIVPVVSRKRNLQIAELYETEEEAEMSSVGKISKVPPVRLRRSPKRFARISAATDAPTITRSDEANDFSPENPHNEEIEVRLCDSSTSDDTQTLVESTATTTTCTNISDNDVNSIITAATDDLKLEQLCDTNLSMNDDDYLNTVDPASEDILKDIDALLKEKSTV